MKFIMEVVLLLDKYKTERIEIIGNETKKQTKSSLFYKGVKTGKIKTDEEALKQLYISPLEIGNYKKFKSRFKARLINTLLVTGINQPYFTNAQRAYYKCYKEWAAIRVLFGRSAKESAATLSIKTLRQALKYEFTELIINLARVLRLYYATVKGL